MKKNPEEKTFFYKYTFDPLVARLYNNKRCRDCYGRGYIISESPRQGRDVFRKHEPLQQTKIYCQCVKKNIKK